MCGIFGYFSTSKHDLGSNLDLLKAMGDAIYHRGPDDSGYYLNGSMAMGMRRLAIIDLKNGQQPISNEDDTLFIVFNGEIYNFKSLYEKLIKLGHKFKTQSDTEVIIHLYEEYGYDCLNYLEGMFAFAIWDKSKNELFIARDRMGEKPLHYSLFGDTLVFGSEIKSILKHPKAYCDLNKEALTQYLTLEYVPSPNTLFANIYKLLPGHFLTVKPDSSLNIQPYWFPDTKINDGINLDEAKADFKQLAKESIEKCLISEVPLGVFLSGGLDSSIIALEASQLIAQKPLQSFSIGFTDKSFDESNHAHLMAKYLKLDHHNFVFYPQTAKESFDSLWQVLDEPIGDASIIPTHYLAKMTRQKVTVALAGEGGDELMGGYPTYLAHNYAKYLSQIPILRNGRLMEKVLKSLPVSYNNLSLDYKAKRFFKHLQHNYLNRHLRWMGSFNLNEQNQLLKSQTLIKNEIDLLENSSKILLPRLNGQNLDLNKIMQLDLSAYLPDDLLVKSDRASMANSLEVRLPFLNHKIVEWALKLPSNLKIKGSVTKYMLRKAYQEDLPASILNRPKKGFGIPVAKWINEDLADLTDKFFSPKFVSSQGLFDQAFLDNLIRLHKSYKVDYRKEIWTLIMFQAWYDKFFN